MTARIMTYVLCGMRHPTTGLSEDDLSRLTGSSSSSTSSSGHSCAAPSSPSSSSSSPSSSASNSPTVPSKPTTYYRDADDIELEHHHHHLNRQSPEKALVSTFNNNNNNNNNNNANNNNNNNINSKRTALTNVSANSPRFNSTYLPEIINPLEWQKSRKRKERLDSTSSSAQDRKLQRSNSEELLPPSSQHDESGDAGVDTAADETVLGSGDVERTLKLLNGSGVIEAIRRVSSEDFKRTPYAVYEKELLKDVAATTECDNGNGSGSGEKIAAEERVPETLEQVDNSKNLSTAPSQLISDENDASLANRQPSLPKELSHGEVTKDVIRHSRYETSPARSHRHSPVRGSVNGGGNGKLRDSEDSECEHERRRSSERFCKSRAPPGRKAAGVMKKSGSVGGGTISGSTVRRGDENVYKYDLSALKYERRGFVSKKPYATNDLNDNNLIDFQQANPLKKLPASSTNAPNTPTTPTTSTTTDAASDEVVSVNSGKPTHTSAQEALPWGRCVPDDQAPMLSRRYAAARHHPAYNLDIDTAAKLSKVMPYPQPAHKQQSHTAAAAMLLADEMDCIEPLETFRAFTSLENVRTRDVMQQVIPAMMSFQSPEERLKQVNKRLTAMKKKLAHLEEAYELRLGYRPSQAERLNDKYMKNILAELSKLRKERHELKTEPMVLGVKYSGGMDATTKLGKMKDTLDEVEQNLIDKRELAHRPDALDELTPDQLLQEKSAVQHGLLYFESLYGRPATKEERDAARPLYDRYRQLKRLVSRSVLLSGCAAAGAPELPTILEHEAMVFEATPQQYSSSANSTDTTNSPNDSLAATVMGGSSDDSTTTTTTTTTAAQTNQTSGVQETSAVIAPPSEANENIIGLSIEQLWEQLERTREEKKLLKRTIREFETIFEEQNGRKMLKTDRKTIEDTYAQYKEKKAKTRLLQALIKKHISR